MYESVCNGTRSPRNVEYVYTIILVNVSKKQGRHKQSSNFSHKTDFSINFQTSFFLSFFEFMIEGSIDRSAPQPRKLFSQVFCSWVSKLLEIFQSSSFRFGFPFSASALRPTPVHSSGLRRRFFGRLQTNGIIRCSAVRCFARDSTVEHKNPVFMTGTTNLQEF